MHDVSGGDEAAELHPPRLCELRDMNTGVMFCRSVLLFSASQWAWASDAHVGVHLAQSVAHGGEVAAQVLHHVLDAARVLQQVDALSVRVVVHRERTLYRLGELPVRESTCDAAAMR